jgi:hypothetical protein
MTALNIRKNTAAILKGAATVIENANIPVPSIKTLHDIRCRAAALMMPNDMAFVITPKTNI